MTPFPKDALTFRARTRTISEVPTGVAFSKTKSPRICWPWKENSRPLPSMRRYGPAGRLRVTRLAAAATNWSEKAAVVVLTASEKLPVKFSVLAAPVLTVSVSEIRPARPAAVRTRYPFPFVTWTPAFAAWSPRKSERFVTLIRTTFDAGVPGGACGLTWPGYLLELERAAERLAEQRDVRQRCADKQSVTRDRLREDCLRGRGAVDEHGRVHGRGAVWRRG